MSKKKLSAIDFIESEMVRKDRAQKAYNNLDHHFDKETYEKGTEWALQRKDIDEAGELANKKSFLNGYARGLRLLKIENDSQNPPMKR